MALWFNSSENRRHIFYSVFIYLVAILISTMGWLITSNTHHKEVYYVDKVTVNVNLLFMNILNHYSFKHQIVTCCHFDSAFHNTYLFIASNYQYVRSFYIQLGGETSCPIKVIRFRHISILFITYNYAFIECEIFTFTLFALLLWLNTKSKTMREVCAVGARAHPLKSTKIYQLVCFLILYDRHITSCFWYLPHHIVSILFL